MRPEGATAAEPIAESAPDENPPAVRMGIALLALLGILLAGYLTLYKLGVFGALLCGTGSCEYVQQSKYAVVLGLPVAAWGVVGYAAVLIVALAGLQPRWAHGRGVPAALLALTTAGLAFTAYLNYLEAFVIHAWCRWCLGSAAIMVFVFLLSLAEIPRLRNRAHD